jgi:hypothetical protein
MPIAMSFANETPLGDVLEYISQATTSRTSSGIHILIHPLGLKQVKRSLDSTVTMDLEGVHLKTTLRLLLKQLDLEYVVKDGLLIISSRIGIRILEGNPGNRPGSKGSVKD